MRSVSGSNERGTRIVHGLRNAFGSSIVSVSIIVPIVLLSNRSVTFSASLCGRPTRVSSHPPSRKPVVSTMKALPSQRPTEYPSHEMLDAAYASGIRYVDAARSYGMAENFLSSWLKTRNPPKAAITIGSKWGYAYTGSWRLDAPVHEVKDLSIDTLRRQIVESRSLLGDRLQLYEIHSATVESRVLENDEVLRELLRLRSGGLVIGLTVTGPNQAETIRHASEDNRATPACL